MTSGYQGEPSFVDHTSSEILSASASEIQKDHADRPLGDGDCARIWQHNSFPEVELFHGSYQKYQFARHFHRVPAMGVVDRGMMSTYCQHGNHVLGAGTVLLFNPGEIHAPAAAGTSGWSFRMFYLDEAFLKSISLNDSMHTLRFKRPFVQDSKLASELFRLHRAMERGGDRLFFESHFVSIFSMLSERHAEPTCFHPETKLDKVAIRNALEYIEMNCHRNLSLAELADLSSYSYSHFLRIFKKALGLTPHAYLIQFRVELATTLLRSGTALADVANALGFTDQSHFTRKFKRVLGVTPGQYAASWT